MKNLTSTLVLGLLLASPLCADDHARGLLLLKEGKFAEAAEAFRAAAAGDPTDPRVHYNLALALWRAGDAAEAELAAEKAATLSDGRLVPLRDGILGNLKMGEAQGKLAGEQADLQAALGAAHKARDHFLHGAAEPNAPAELTRNLERALHLIAEIEKKIEEQKQQEQKDDQQKQDDKEQPKDDAKPDDEKKDGDEKEQGKEGDKKEDEKQQEGSEPEKKEPEKKEQDKKEQDKSDEQKEPDQKQPGKPEDKPPEPKPEPKEPPPDPKSEDGAPQPKPGEKEEKPEPKVGAEEQEEPPPEPKDGQPAPPPQVRELSPEETKRLLDVLERVHAQQAELEKARAAARPKVKKDW